MHHGSCDRSDEDSSNYFKSRPKRIEVYGPWSLSHSRTKASATTFTLAVADTGRGIETVDQAVLFEPFYQKKFTDQEQGTGSATDQ